MNELTPPPYSNMFIVIIIYNKCACIHICMCIFYPDFDMFVKVEKSKNKKIICCVATKKWTIQTKTRKTPASFDEDLYNAMS